MVYNNDKSLNYLLFEEGMVNKVTGGYAYEYHLKDHLGNTRVTFQPNGTSTTVTQVAEYYPFGSSYLPVSPAGNNLYLYNGKEKQDDKLSLTRLDWLDYGARFYDPLIGRFHTLDRFAEKYLDFSPYQYAANNPVLNIDVNGDSINVSNLYSKSKDGQYLNPTLIAAFELFASTKTGNQYILDHAQKGFELKGVFVDGLDIKAEKGGVLNDKGVDISLNEGAVIDNNGNPALGKTDNNTVDGRLKLSFTFDNNEAKSFSGSIRDNLLNSVDSYSHEFFLHGYLNEQKFLNGSSINPYKHTEESVYSSKYMKGEYFENTIAHKIINAVQSMNIKMNQGASKYTSKQIYNKFVAPGLNWEKK